MYIRTKNGVYKIDEIKPYFLDEKQKLFINNELKIAANEKQVIDQADTIEELCDLYIDEETKTIFHKHNGYVINWKTNMVYSLKALSESYHSVKGAIYTDKGLIYVAKLNEEGELELL